MDIKNKKHDFLLGQFFSMSIFAAFSQRGPKVVGKKRGVYKAGTSEDERKAMRDFLFDSLRGWSAPLERRGEGLSKEELVSYISELKKNVDDKFELILNSDNENEITFGTLQKLVNLYLKYLWVSGFLGANKPPHCPIDRKILEKIDWQGVSWPKMGEKDYEQAIAMIKREVEKADDKSMAEWELRVWQNLSVKADNESHQE